MALKALLVGINRYNKQPLRGCVNDVLRMRDTLHQLDGLSDDQTRLLLDETATTAALLEGLDWLAAPDGSDTPPVRLFHFSGHGIQVADTTGTEPDGKTEALALYDHPATGALLDDQLRECYNLFDPATHLVLSMDCCHAGDIHYAPGLDVVYRFLEPPESEQARIDEAAWNYERAFFIKRDTIEQELQARGLAGAELQRETEEQTAAALRRGRPDDPTNDFAVLLAAARENQLAADARFAGTYHGALTYHMTELLRQSGGTLSYADLLEQTRQRLEQEAFDQVPHLACSEANRTRRFLA